VDQSGLGKEMSSWAVVLEPTEKQFFLKQLRITGFFKNDMRYINSRFTYLLTYLLQTSLDSCMSASL